MIKTRVGTGVRFREIRTRVGDRVRGRLRAWVNVRCIIRIRDRTGVGVRDMIRRGQH